VSGQSSSARSQTPVETKQEAFLLRDQAESFLLALKSGLIPLREWNLWEENGDSAEDEGSGGLTVETCSILRGC
jgi:hypothetical protein